MDEMFLHMPIVDRKMSPRTYHLALRELGAYRRRQLRKLAKHVAGETETAPIPFSLTHTAEGWQLTTFLPGLGKLFYFAKHRRDFKDVFRNSSGRDDLLAEWIGEATE